MTWAPTLDVGKLPACAAPPGHRRPRPPPEGHRMADHRLESGHQLVSGHHCSAHLPWAHSGTRGPFSCPHQCVIWSSVYLPLCHQLAILSPVRVTTNSTSICSTACWWMVTSVSSCLLLDRASKYVQGFVLKYFKMILWIKFFGLCRRRKVKGQH